MRKLFIILAGIVAFWACNNEKKKDETSVMKEDKQATTAVSYPYTARYSSQFSLGKDEDAQHLLAVWKTWDNNKLDDAKSYFADTVEMFLADNTHFRVPVDSFLNVGKSMRNNYPELNTEVDAWLPLHSTDKNEDWVAIWGVEKRKDKMGKVDSSGLHEVWRVNKKGKFDLVFQYEQKLMPPPAPPK